MKNGKRVLALIFMVFMSVFAYALPVKETKLKAQNWAPDTYAALNRMIEKNSINNQDYNLRSKPYAVFDFDNTTAMNDIQEALLIYQLENLRFKMTPQQLDAALKTEYQKAALQMNSKIQKVKS